MIKYIGTPKLRAVIFIKTLIIYASKNGSTKKAAALLAANIGADFCDMFEVNEKLPQISNYECVAVGSYIRMGVIDKKIAAFIKNNKEELFGTKFGLFICSCLEDKVSEAVEKNFNEELLDKAAAVDWFGGELAEDKIKGMDKLLVKMMLKATKADPNFRMVNKIHPEAITAFANRLKES